jgi:hypothetical protein
MTVKPAGGANVTFREPPFLATNPRIRSSPEADALGLSIVTLYAPPLGPLWFVTASPLVPPIMIGTG